MASWFEFIDVFGSCDEETGVQATAVGIGETGSDGTGIRGWVTITGEDGIVGASQSFKNNYKKFWFKIKGKYAIRMDKSNCV